MLSLSKIPKLIVKKTKYKRNNKNFLVYSLRICITNILLIVWIIDKKNILLYFFFQSEDWFLINLFPENIFSIFSVFRHNIFANTLWDVTSESLTLFGWCISLKFSYYSYSFYRTFSYYTIYNSSQWPNVSYHLMFLFYLKSLYLSMINFFFIVFWTFSFDSTSM